MKVKQRRLTGWRRLFLMPLLLPAVLPLVLVAGLVLPGTALAQSTITVDRAAQLIGKTTVRVSGTATCFGGASDGQVEVIQSSFKKVAEGFGSFTVTCDGTTHTYQADVNPNVFSVPGVGPFHTGAASAHAILFAENAQTGTVAIHIKG